MAIYFICLLHNSLCKLDILQNIINRQWISLSDNDKTEIRLTLWNELLAKHEVMVYFIRNKLAALMVAIARYDWPHLYDDFFSNIVEVNFHVIN